jgi:glycosyltransferase involved in cell wall biosynthesis
MVCHSKRFAAPPMKIVIAHNRYQQYGGEDVVFEREAELLSSVGHHVHKLEVSNAEIRSPWDKAVAMLRTVENPTGVALMAATIREFKPDIVHIHNFFPLLSPAVYNVCHAEKIPVVQTLHNYRPICANGLLFRSNQACHLCVDRTVLWGIYHRCYQKSLPGSLAAARMIAFHKKRKTWITDVDQYIALSEFSRRIFIQAGFPADRITVKPNFIRDPGPSSTDALRQGAFYVGRLSDEKGVRVLLEACLRFGFPLRIAGDGPELSTLKAMASVETIFLGRISNDAVLDEMRKAAVVVVPSLCYENFPLAILEAFACATPVIASRCGSITEMIESGETGILTPTGDVEALGQNICRIIADRDLARKLGEKARRRFVEHFSLEQSLQALENIYKKAKHNFFDDSHS